MLCEKNVEMGDSCPQLFYPAHFHTVAFMFYSAYLTSAWHTVQCGSYIQGGPAKVRPTYILAGPPCTAHDQSILVHNCTKSP